MRQYLKLFFLFSLCAVLCKNSLVAEEAKPLPTPWTLQVGWWNDSVAGEIDARTQRLEALSNSLNSLEEKVPQENVEFVRAAVERIQLNIKQYLTLAASSGVNIQSAPELHESYSVEELLQLAKQVKVEECKAQDYKADIKKLKVIQERTNRRIDNLYIDYAATEQQSLQRTTIGLNLMVAVTNRGIIQERIRLTEEQFRGAELSLTWARSTLTAAKERLALGTVDVVALEGDIAKVKQRLISSDQELLELETRLAAGGPRGEFDNRVMEASTKLIAHARLKVELLIAEARRALAISAAQTMPSDQAQVVLAASKEWLDNLTRIGDQAREWKEIIRREQDSSERTLLRDEEIDSTRYKALLVQQRSAQEALLHLSALELEAYQARQVVKLATQNIVQNLGWLDRVWNQAWISVQNSVAVVFDYLSRPLFRLQERPVSVLKIFGSVLIFLLAYLASQLMQRGLTALANRKQHISTSSLYTFNRVGHYFLMTLGVIWSLGFLGFDFSSLIIIAGALSVGIGFGLQGIVNNFLGGLIVLFDRKLRVGDFIELSSGELGTITEVNAQNTVIRTLTGHDILVPNSDIITRQLTNWTLRDQYARLHIPFGVAYGSDKEKVKEVIEKAARNVMETVFNHKTIADPTVWLVGFGDSSLNFELVVWVDFRRSRKRRTSLTAAYLWEVETALRENQIEIPFPQRDLHIKSGLTPLKGKM